jgi:hypothetical protein
MLQGELYFSYVEAVRTSEETYLWASTVCFRESFILLLLLLLLLILD